MNVAILIINYQSHEILSDCVASIQEEFLEIQIHILNNDPQIQLGTSRFESSYQIKIHDIGRNIGYAAGVNYLVNQVINTNYFFLLNPDAFLSKNAIYKLFKSLITNDKIAAISPSILNLQNNLWFNCGKIDWLNNRIINVCNNSQDLVFETDLFNGCASLMKKDAFIKAGGLKELLFMYYDEAFLSEALRKIGYKIYHDQNVQIVHNVSYTTRNNSSIKTYFITRNGLVFFLKFGKGSNKKTIFRYLIRGLYFIKHFDIKNLVAYYTGMIDTTKIYKRLNDE